MRSAVVKEGILYARAAELLAEATVLGRGLDVSLRRARSDWEG